MQTLPVVLGVLLCGLGACGETRLGVAFDAEVWRDLSRVADGARFPMAERLVSEHALIGKTSSELFDLLGPPDPPLLCGMEDWWILSVEGRDGEETVRRLIVQCDDELRVTKAEILCP